MPRIVIIGGGPAGYESALTARQLGAEVILVEDEGVGGGCVLYDCVPSKTFIASAGGRTAALAAGELGVMIDDEQVTVDLRTVNERVEGLALAQSLDIRNRLELEGVEIVAGRAQLADSAPGLAAHRVEITGADGTNRVVDTELVLLATGASPRVLDTAMPDGERILTWRQIYDLTELPEHLIVVGSGVTGAEFASAYTEMGVQVTLVSSRDRVLPGEDADAAAVIEQVFHDRGATLAKQARAASVVREGDGVLVTLVDGREVRGSHCLMTVGSVPNSADLGLEKVGVETGPGGFITVDRVSRTNVTGIYAAGDCTGVLMLASVAAMQGRIAIWHALGEGAPPLRLKSVSSNIFTHPEIATVGVSQSEVDNGTVPARALLFPLATNARAKMLGLNEGFVKLIVRPATGIIIGGVVVSPAASELILAISVAVQNRLTVKDLAYSFSVYPSLSGTITELGRRLINYAGDLG
ncbi:NAD(P)H-quinone dehydrogenase [Nakamurella flavida]|uniref:NAD(P)H-quinone dehydrogenase n=1 Tax=Nakamurella flavida TaxID=363630 RepID=A0A938YT98_9ACTN|nr:NAD(P)H-quinone dehydrogenase [Nakamurella flavida]MBM9478465.1 NAD(P)H-quinone dehydrogenase [Nakamurella flavida]MDP9777709.1 dihydrolipoamide dehydrogenase [Nakamurella flavida]